MTKGTDYTVIGVLGAPGAGKSRLMNELCGFQHHGSMATEQLPFQVADAGAGPLKHCTAGVDIRVSADRVIAIDTQPVRSSSIVAELLQADSPPPGLLPALQDMCSSNTGHQAKPVTNVSAEAVAELMDLQLAMWLLRVVVMTNDFYSPDVWWLLSNAGMLLARLPDPAVPADAADRESGRDPPGAAVLRGPEVLPPMGTVTCCHPLYREALIHWRQGVDRTAQVVLGASGVDFGLPAQDDIISACVAAGQVLQGSGIKLARHVCVPSWLDLPTLGEGQDSSHVPGEFHSKAAPAQPPRDRRRWNECGLSFLLPSTDNESHRSAPEEGAEDTAMHHATHAALSKSLCQQILALHRQQRKSAMSEQEWLTAAENTWRAIQQSADLGEFVMQLQETKLLSAGGWRVS
ncbi:uncharacterized protein LOC142355893 [Convolutriloba macropyga]|uniref:uncharacterized protein LOC142355893 n=1 Tax=Convolutriloba macropyga TaxID=536237 RepID=UPI003F520985